MVLETYTEPEYRNMVAENINGLIRAHFKKTNDPIRDADAHPLSGCSWKFLAKIAIKGDFKGRQSQTMMGEGEKILKKLNISLDEAQRLYGKRA